MAEKNKEREYQSELNQERQETKTETSGESAHGPASTINAAELLIILGLAITVDLIDVLDLTGFGAIISRAVDLPCLGLLWLWRIMKHQAGPKKDPTLQVLTAFLGEISPFGILPIWTIFVLYVYFQDSKLGQKTIGAAKKATIKT